MVNRKCPNCVFLFYPRAVNASLLGGCSLRGGPVYINYQINNFCEAFLDEQDLDRSWGLERTWVIWDLLQQP